MTRPTPPRAGPVRTLLFSTLYPSRARPNHGLFVETRLRELLASGEVESTVVAPVPWFPSRHSRFGRDLYAIGNEPASARYVGIPIARRLLWTYGLSGAVAGLCGYLWVARYAVAYTEIAYGFEFTVIAACVIGGISIAGGCGSVTGAVLGALFLAVIGNALPVVKVSPFWQSALTGVVILVAVLINARGGRGTRDESWPAEVLAACDRRRAGQTAPPHGLFLVRVNYNTK